MSLSNCSFDVSERLDDLLAFPLFGDDETRTLSEDAVTALLDRTRLGVFGEEGGLARLTGFAGFLKVATEVPLSTDGTRFL
jgi:hypothetical protein